MRSLKGKKIAILVTNGFEESELFEPKKVLEKSGAEVTVDDNIITSRKPDDIEAFNKKIIELLS